MKSRRSAITQLVVMAGAVPLALAGGTEANAVVLPVKSAARDDTDGDSSLQLVDVIGTGAKGDGATDDTAPIRKAIQTVAQRDSYDAGNGAGVVYFPAGTYAVTEPIEVPRNVLLVGESAMAVRVRYLGERTDVFLTFGQAGQIATYSGLRNIAVDADGRADTTVLMYGPQEGATIADSMVVGALKTGVRIVSDGIVGGSNKFTVERSWIWTIGDDGAAGISIGAGGGPLAIRDTTFVGTNRGGDAPANSAGIVAVRSIVAIDDVNVEHFESHTYLDRTQADIRNVTGFFNPYGIKTSPTSKNTAVYLTNGLFDGAQASILDQGTDVRIGVAHSYWSEAYRFDQRHFRRNFWEVGSANVWRSEKEQTVLGYDSPAGGDGGRFAVSALQGGQWRRTADVDETGVFGAADSAHDGAHLRLGEYHLWVDSTGALRMKRGAPVSDTDGSPVGG